ncbi:MAG: hypothetical protein NVS4B6_26360 [Mycobacterium sp.]
MNIHICPACGYPTLTARMCAACIPVAVAATRQPSSRATASGTPGAVRLSAVVDLGATAV